MNIEPILVAKNVQEMLIAKNAHTAKARVLGDEVWHDADLWYVPVSVQRDTEWMATIYDTFSEIEEELEEQKGLRVLIVPRIVPFQRWSETA
ncbi:MAG: hypothetical protein K2W85_06205 [Phycisphaerales bacterium]|nr:hypothetical protein [Phycisphaerales bacterium]